jgi:hypothetical protein
MKAQLLLRHVRLAAAADPAVVFPLAQVQKDNCPETRRDVARGVQMIGVPPNSKSVQSAK